MSKVNYKIIFEDILRDLHPEKKDICSKILSKKNLKSLDIITLNKMIFGKDILNKFKSYSEDDIIYMLKYKKEHNLNITQLANHFVLSRNTVSKWMKIYKV